MRLTPPPRSRLLAAVLPLALCGCLSQLLPETPPVTTYDFGAAPDRAAAPLARPVRLDAVLAPSWLQTPNIYYRTLDEQPNALVPYAHNRWVAAAPELFAERLRFRLAAAEPAAAGDEISLVLELVRFEHVYESAADAYVVAQAVASYEDAEGRTRRQTFEQRRGAAASVGGATAELPRAAEALLSEVLVWLGGEALNASR